MTQDAGALLKLAARIEGYAVKYRGDWSCATPSLRWEELDTVVAALRQAASQGSAGGERSAVQSGEPVAWRYRFVTSVDGKELSDWFIVDDPKRIPSREAQTVQPLYASVAQAPSQWQPIATEPNDGNYRLYRLTVNHRDGTSWGEVHYLAWEDGGDMIDASGDKFSDWSHSDFEHWAEAPSMPSASRGTEA